MELKERLEFCKICENKKFDSKIGIVCSLTDLKPIFISKCPDFIVDNDQLKRIESSKIKKELNNSLPKGAVAATIISLIVIIIRFLL